MRVKRKHLTVLLNRLHDRGDDEFIVEHPSDEIGELLRIELSEHDACTITFPTNTDDYTAARQEIGRQYPNQVFEDLPEAAQFQKAVLASGVIDPANQDEIETFLDRYGDPDLMAGHPRAFAGFDTNVMPWRIDSVDRKSVV